MKRYHLAIFLFICLYSCNARIDKHLNIYITDTAKYEGICDSTGKYVPNSDTTFIYSKTGRVDGTGKIKFGNEVVQKNRNTH